MKGRRLETYLQVPLQSCDILTTRFHVIQSHLIDDENDNKSETLSVKKVLFTVLLFLLSFS